MSGFSTRCQGSNASALGQRLPGSFSSARKMAASSSSLMRTWRAALRGGTGVSSVCLSSTAIGESASNGARPVTM